MHSTLEELRARFEKPRLIKSFHLSAEDFEYLLDLAELGEQSRREILTADTPSSIMDLPLYDFKVVCGEPQTSEPIPEDLHVEPSKETAEEIYSLDRYGVSGDFWVFGFMDSLDKMSKANPFLSVFQENLKSWQATWGIPLLAAGLNQ